MILRSKIIWLAFLGTDSESTSIVGGACGQKTGKLPQIWTFAMPDEMGTKTSYGVQESGIDLVAVNYM